MIQTTFPSCDDNKNRIQKLPSGSRYTNTGTGVQVVLDESGPWTDLGANPGTSPPGQSKNKPTGMLGFLSKRRGRASSPKPQERGVLGREGARVVVA